MPEPAISRVESGLSLGNRVGCSAATPRRLHAKASKRSINVRCAPWAGAPKCGRASLRRGHSLVEHVNDSAADLWASEIGHSASRGRTTVSLDRGANHSLEPLLRTRSPRRAIADPWRSANTTPVALHALCAHNLLAAAVGSRRRCLVHQYCPMATGPVDQVGNRELDLEIGDAWITPVRRHLPDSIDRVLGKAAQAPRSARI